MRNGSEYIQFLAEARSGDRVALGRLATLVWDRIYRFAFRTTLDHNAAEDVVQETLLTMICGLGTLRDDRRFWPWIYRIAWHKVQDRLRDRRRRSTFQTTVLGQRDTADDGRADDEDLLDAQVRAETLRQVAAAVGELNPQHRHVVQLRCYEQLPYTEIADRTRTTPEQARVHFHRAKESLRRHLVCRT